MKILGIETSCHEPAAAVVGDGVKILSNIVASQIDLHRAFGGVVPEVAARSHIEVILPVIETALEQAHVSWPKIDAMAVTYGPGLPGALLVGVITARTLALVKNKPLIAVDHVAAHAYANFLGQKTGKPDSSFRIPDFPLLALIVSGGHSQLVLFQNHFDYKVLGETLDDAAGEAFDKVAKMLGLGFPGGPAIAKAATQGSPLKYSFTEPKLDNQYDFSFSGIKTAVLRHLQALVKKDYRFASHHIAPLLTQSQVNDTAASFQKTVVDWLVERTLMAYKEFEPKTVVIAGGVAANQHLRQQLAAQLPIPITYPPINLCTDNAAMIAGYGYFLAKAKRFSNALTLETEPSLSM